MPDQRIVIIGNVAGASQTKHKLDPVIPARRKDKSDARPCFIAHVLYGRFHHERLSVFCGTDIATGIRYAVLRCIVPFVRNFDVTYFHVEWRRADIVRSVAVHGDFLRSRVLCSERDENTVFSIGQRYTVSFCRSSMYRIYDSSVRQRCKFQSRGRRFFVRSGIHHARNCRIFVFRKLLKHHRNVSGIGYRNGIFPVTLNVIFARLGNIRFSEPDRIDKITGVASRFERKRFARFHPSLSALDFTACLRRNVDGINIVFIQTSFHLILSIRLKVIILIRCRTIAIIKSDVHAIA